MRYQPTTLKSFAGIVACAVLTLGVAASIRAEDKKIDPTGTWSWVMPGRNGGPDRTNTLTLKLEGDKLTGKVASPRRGGEIAETAIADGKLAGSDISFTVTRELGGNSMTSKYAGKVGEDKIEGKIEFERDGEAQSRDWTANRVKDTKAEGGKADDKK